MTTRFFRVLMVLVGSFVASSAFAWSVDVGGVGFASTSGHNNAVDKSPLCRFIDGAVMEENAVSGDRQFEYVFRKSGEPLVVVKVLLSLPGSSAYVNAVSWPSVVAIAQPTMRMLIDSGYRLIGNQCEGINPSSVVTIMVQ